MHPLKAYLFKTKDPAIDTIRTVFQDHFGDRRLSGKQLKSVETSGGPTVNTMRNWFYGATKRPLNATIEAAGRAIDYQRKWVSLNGKSNGKRR